MGGALEFAAKVLSFLPAALSGVTSAIDVMNQGKALVESFVTEKRGPTDAEWAVLNEAVIADRTKLHSDDV